ncbi:hypothetical protein Sjap_025721 [Stephania japonica]|uniref:Protein FAR1-RELATED SEQUENCE n=1 Tax=Stephania japonica TaxID=461633 RepID=A0AAP0E4T5_9MAGN
MESGKKFGRMDRPGVWNSDGATGLSCDTTWVTPIMGVCGSTDPKVHPKRMTWWALGFGSVTGSVATIFDWPTIEDILLDPRSSKGKAPLLGDLLIGAYMWHPHDNVSSEVGPTQGRKRKEENGTSASINLCSQWGLPSNSTDAELTTASARTIDWRQVEYKTSVREDSLCEGDNNIDQPCKGVNYKVVGVMRGIDRLTTYDVWDITIPSGLHESPKRVYQVVYHEALEELKCICRSYESCGILCCHALFVFYDRDVMEIPTKYIMDRWRKNFKRKYAGEKTILELDTSAITVMERHNAITIMCNHLTELGSASSKKLKMVYKGVKLMQKALIDASDDDKSPIPLTQASTKTKQIVKDPLLKKHRGEHGKVDSKDHWIMERKERE